METAVTAIIDLVWEDHSVIENAEAKLRLHEAETERGYDRVQAPANDDLEDPGLATGAYWDTYFGADNDRYYAQEEVDNLKNKLAVHAFSRSAMSASLLQYAKQGISIVHANLGNAPAARQVHGVQLKDIFWQGRNQALHWEEGDPMQRLSDALTNSNLSTQLSPTITGFFRYRLVSKSARSQGRPGRTSKM